MAKSKLTAKQKAAKAKKEKARRDAKKAAKKAAAAADPAASNDDDKPEPAKPPSAAKRRGPRWAGLVTLDEWNADRKQRWAHPIPSDDEPNGIACPHCGEQTLDRSPGKRLDGSPPRVEIHCNSVCGYVGRRIA